MRRIRQRRTLLALIAAVTMSLALGIPVAADLNLVIGGTANVAYTNGDGVNVRNAPGYTGGIISTLTEGTEVTVLDGPVTADDGTGWFYVSATVDGEYIEGWANADYLSGDAPADNGGGSDDSSNQGPAPVASDTVVATVVNTDGNGLRMRDGASTDAATITLIPEGASVEVLATDITDDSGITWAQVSYDGTVGFSSQDYLQIGSAGSTDTSPPTEQPPAEQPPAEQPAPTDLSPGNSASVSGTGGTGLNLRYDSGYDAGVITVIGEGEVVSVLDGPVYDSDGNGWYQVDYSGTTGWVNGAYLTPAGAPPAENPSLDDSSGGGDPVGSESGIGAQIVAEALNYVGVPYVWGGTTPSGFDCSGFTYFIVNKVMNNGFSRDMAEQVVSGSYVDPSNLSAGDLVFFQNTYKWGLSHVGIYVRDGTFVHAGSERTGVVVSNVWDSYWGPRYYTARRIAE